MVMDVSMNESSWNAGTPSSRDDLLLFFAAVLGSREGMQGFDVAEALDGFSAALAKAFPDGKIHLQLEGIDSWSGFLHVVISHDGDRQCYRKLFWSVD